MVIRGSLAPRVVMGTIALKLLYMAMHMHPMSDVDANDQGNCYFPGWESVSALSLTFGAV